jgi:hypothetical protein
MKISVFKCPKCGATTEELSLYETVTLARRQHVFLGDYGIESEIDDRSDDEMVTNPEYYCGVCDELIAKSEDEVEGFITEVEEEEVEC